MVKSWEVEMEQWLCNLCKCDGFRCTCVGGNKFIVYVCKKCTFQTIGPDNKCRRCGGEYLIKRDGA